MITSDDPPPLDAPTSGSPESLVRALRALGREQPSEAALRATGLRLQARLNAPHVTAPAQHATVQVASTNTLLVGRLIMAALTATVGVGSFMYVQSGKPASERPSASTLPLRTGSPVSDAAPAVVPVRPTAPPATRQSFAPKSRGTAHDAATSRRTVPAHVVSPKPSDSVRVGEQGADKPPARMAAATAVSAHGTADSGSKPDSPPAKVSAAAPPAPEPTAAERAAVPKQPAVGSEELALLRAAQKQLHVDPSSVLRLTAEHARRFPVGALAPEREVLAIEALRALGRTDQASVRLHRFRATYPDSLHTPALTKGTTP